MNKLETWNVNQRRMFKPNKAEDLKLAKKYFNTNSWGINGCPFYLEWPYLDIPCMLRDKITDYALRSVK
jgi:hypothetical protein